MEIKNIKNNKIDEIIDKENKEFRRLIKNIKDNKEFIVSKNNLKLSKNELFSLSYYKGSGYYDINQMLLHEKIFTSLFKLKYHLNLNSALHKGVKEKTDSWEIPVLNSLKNKFENLSKLKFDKKENDIIKKILDYYEVKLQGININEYTKIYLEELKKHITTMDKIFLKAPKLKDVVLYRGMDISKFPELLTIEESMDVKFDNFLSTSFNSDIAFRFSKYKKIGGILILSIKREIPYIYLSFNNNNKPLEEQINYSNLKFCYQEG